MKLGFVGLGKMGYNLCLNLHDHKHEVVAYNRSHDKLEHIRKEGINVAYSLKELTTALPNPRIIWLMVTAGNVIDDLIDDLLPLLSTGDIIIDGGNSYYKDTIRRSEYLKKHQIEYMDIGTSGGISGARNGACMMIGGNKEVFDRLEPVFKTINTEDGYAYLGLSGAGHYTKMIHNGIEYGMMQALGEGYQLLSKSEFNLDFEKVSKVWSNGSIITGLLVELLHNAFCENPTLEGIERYVDASGEGEWTVLDAIEKRVSAPVITSALYARFKSKDDDYFSEKVVASLRNQFGGHKLYKK